MISGRMVLIILLCFGILACGRETEAKEAAPEPQPILLGPEDVATVTTGEIITGPPITGELQAREQATVRAQLAGSLQQVNVRVGESVKQGQVLARIRAVAEREQASSAQAAVRTAETQLEAARRDAERTETLVKAGALAQRDLEQARTTVASAEAAVAEAKARLAAAREQLQEAVVRAPISGRIGTAAVQTGDVVQIGAELFSILDLHSLELKAFVTSDRLGSIRPGTPVMFNVQGYQDRQFRGVIQRVDPSADPETRQVEIYASIPNTTGILVAGLYATGRVATGVEAIVVPAEAVQSRGDSSYVLKVHEGQVIRQDVSVGERDDRTGKLQIVSGLQPGETVLTGASAALRPGARVAFRDKEQADKR
jgi:RND family efflux transporter MFP subunit